MWVSQNDFSDSKWLLCSRVYHNINGIGKSIVKICDFLLFFFHCWRVGRVGTPSKPCRRSEKKKRTLAGHRNLASRTRSGVRHRHGAKNGVSVQPRCFAQQIINTLYFVFHYFFLKDLVVSRLSIPYWYGHTRWYVYRYRNINISSQFIYRLYWSYRSILNTVQKKVFILFYFFKFCNG